MQKTNERAVNGKLIEKIEALQPWFHNLHLHDGVQTAPDHYFGDFPKFKWKEIQHKIPKNLEGWSALDIGCNAGFYSFELAKRGAKVLGIDLDPHYLKQAKWAARQFGFEQKVQFKQMQVYDLKKLKRNFDIVLFMGVFYHLRYPTLALDIVTQKVNKLFIFQTLTMPGNEVYMERNLVLKSRHKMLKKGWPLMAFIEGRLAGDPTNWWAPNHSCILSLLRSCGLKVIANPGHEIYIAKPDQSLTAVSKTWNKSEFLSATGDPWLQKLEVKVHRK